MHKIQQLESCPSNSVTAYFTSFLRQLANFYAQTFLQKTQGSIRKGRCGDWPNMLQVPSKAAPQQSEHEHFMYNSDY